jgi:dTDP-glucose 4,6-dehydratase
MHLLVSGGAGFIGSHFVKHVFRMHPSYRVTVLDKLTYAGNLDNLIEVKRRKKYRFVRGDICDAKLVNRLARDCDAILNFAAETHVDRSILGPGSFVTTDVFGTHVLLEAVRAFGIKRYVQISTDEVYGSIERGSFKETDPLHPSSPYSASKAGADLLVRAYYNTYKLPVLITRSSNNFGPNQYPEKLIPLFITNLIEGKKIPLYGDGLNVRDWLYVGDNCEGIDTVLHKGKAGEAYNIGAGNERTNLELTYFILKALGEPKSMIKKVKDRPGHDRRYSIDCRKAHALGWRPRHRFEDALQKTISWYQQNKWWWRKLKDREFQRYYQSWYGPLQKIPASRAKGH